MISESTLPKFLSSFSLKLKNVVVQCLAKDSWRVGLFMRDLADTSAKLTLSKPTEDVYRYARKVSLDDSFLLQLVKINCLDFKTIVLNFYFK